MTRETILLLIRHCLTAVGVLLTQLKITTDAEWKPLADSIATASGSICVALALAWSIRKAWKRRKTDPANTPTPTPTK